MLLLTRKRSGTLPGTILTLFEASKRLIDSGGDVLSSLLRRYSAGKVSATMGTLEQEVLNHAGARWWVERLAWLKLSKRLHSLHHLRDNITVHSKRTTSCTGKPTICTDTAGSRRHNVARDGGLGSRLGGICDMMD